MKTRRKSVPEPIPETRRCAIYTRKSASVGLEQDFNSLDAQREACTAYIKKQTGWTLLTDRYDDGGFTGANIERPAFQRLLADIDDGQVDVVVVYKVDRLSRSLLDFAKLMECFGRAGTSFVSVTQNFSTADAMGRLTLNMLMSFAEFEREMIGKRTLPTSTTSVRQSRPPRARTGRSTGRRSRSPRPRAEISSLCGRTLGDFFSRAERRRTCAGWRPVVPDHRALSHPASR
jgi:DNA invertase Pin-like site-specific DNA recombinase